MVPGHVTESSLQMAYSEADRFGWSEADLEAYEYRGMRIQDERGALDHAREQGREVGRQEGELAKAIETARKMRAKGYSVADIAELTGLAVAEIEEL